MPDPISVASAEQQISSHIAKSGIQLSRWYVGIAEDPDNRLFTEHNVPRDNYWWIYRELATKEAAAEVEKFFLDKGARGGGGGGTDKSVFAYAFVIGSNTKEES